MELLDGLVMNQDHDKEPVSNDGMNPMSAPMRIAGRMIATENAAGWGRFFDVGRFGVRRGMGQVKHVLNEMKMDIRSSTLCTFHAT